MLTIMSEWKHFLFITAIESQLVSFIINTNSSESFNKQSQYYFKILPRLSERFTRENYNFFCAEFTV